MAELRTPQGHTLLLPEGCVSVGADPANDVPVAAHLGLAPVHFRLQPWEGGHFLEDAGSGLGTLVNGHSVNWKPLTHGDIIIAGELEVVYDQQAKPATSPVPVIVAPSLTTPAAYALPAAAGLFPSISDPGMPSFPAGPPSLPGPVLAPPGHPMLPAPPVAHHPVPPAWLPADLLPESYKLPENPETPAAAEKATEDVVESPPVPSRKSHRTRRRVLPAMLVVGFLAWAGHTAWQRGHFAPFFQAFHTAPTPTAVPRVPSTVPAPQSSTPMIPASPKPSGNTAVSPAPPDAATRITSQIDR